MPVLKRTASRPDSTPDPRDRWTWANGSGCDPLLGGPRYPNERAARRAWNTVGRACMWAECGIGRVPAGARHYDGITEAGFEAFIAMWSRVDWYVQPVLDGINADRESVVAFRTEQPAAARTVARYLDRYLAYLDQLEQDALALRGTAHGDRGPFAQGRHSRTCYGDEELAQ
jgi:hypothetical protein